MEVINTCELSDKLRENLFTLVGHLIADKQVSEKRAKQIRIYST